tara:strand:+ start:255 stop:674 length:420 start_codon:yes stop_codon:yes gene_type:complete
MDPKGNYREIRLFASGRGVDGHVEGVRVVHVQWYHVGKHALEVGLLEALVGARDGHATELRVDEVWAVAHDGFEAAVLFLVLFQAKTRGGQKPVHCYCCQASARKNLPASAGSSAADARIRVPFLRRCTPGTRAGFGCS